MADINGLVKRQATLANDTEQTITFPGGVKAVALSYTGAATKVLFKETGLVASIADDTANVLSPDVRSINFGVKDGFNRLSFRANGAASLQWFVLE